MKKLLSLSLALLLMGCSSPDPIENQFFGCTLGESSEADVIAAMEGYEYLGKSSDMDVIAAIEGYEMEHYRQFYIDYSNVPFVGAVWERASFVIYNDTLRGMVFSDERRLPFVMYVERFNKKYAKYCKTEGKDSISEWHDYSDGKTQIELVCADVFPGTMLIYRDRSSKRWQEL